ncbi:MAG: 6-carboxytetrahydropterin synthase [Gemmatimonadota bacterium]|nr:6-carboxytetrahydropterin synthase [Gemmatimonadota bacterium]MDH5196461.1 6-carboxytetrahydropterin synthase [Gemmatimonadota bacterium]
MPVARLTRVVRFSAAHRYYRPDWDAATNTRVFGLCAREHGHGHNYRCAVTVRGEVASDSGMVMDLAELDRLLTAEVRESLDHRHLNHDVPAFAFGGTIPTAEALAIWVWQRLAPRLPAGVQLHTVRIEEDDDLFAEYSGDA